MATFDRRRFLRIGGAAAVGTLPGCLGLTSTAGSSSDSTPWPAPGGGPERTWARPSATAVTEPLSRTWSRELPGPVYLHAVVDGTAFLTSSDRVLALDASSGEQRWKLPDLSGTGGVFVEDESVYVSHHDRLQVLDASDGSEEWSFERDDAGRLGDPVVSDGKVYVMGSSLYVLDAQSGEIRWEEPYVHNWTKALTVSNGDVYRRQSHARVACHRRGHTGPVWSVSLPLRYVDQPRAGDGLLYVGGDVDQDTDDQAALFALDPATGERQWQYDGDGAYTEVSAPAIGSDAVYVTVQTADGAGGLAAVDATTGDERWRTTYDRELSGPSLFGGTVYAAVETDLVGVAADDGTPQLERSFFDDVATTPIVVGDHLYAIVDDELYAFEQG